MSRLAVAIAAAVCALAAICAGVWLYFAGPTGSPPASAPSPAEVSPTPTPSDTESRTTHSPAGQSPDGYSTYVALGDSFASMSSRSTVDTADQLTAVCDRSADNYAHLLAQALNLELSDVTCQGGVLGDITSPRQSDYGPIPAQVTTLGPETTLVTLTMGGNDIDFLDLATCAATQVRNAWAGVAQTPCADSLAAGVEEAFARLPARYDDAYTAIQQAAPNARIIATGYLPLIGPSDTCDFAASLPAGDQAWFATITDRINAEAKAAALRNGADYVLPADTSAHTACASPVKRWSSFDGQVSGTFPMHPTSAGHQAMADAIAATLHN